MTRFELKKVFSRRINQIVLFILAALLALCILGGLNSVVYSIPDSSAAEGVRYLSGHAAAVRLRADTAQYEGPLTAEVLRRVIEDNRRIYSMPQAQSKSIPDKNYVYTFTQGYRDIRSLTASAYTPFNEYDYYTLDSLSPEDADRFYALRTRSLTDWLDDTDRDELFTPAEREFLISRYEALETPMLYHPSMGWEAVFELAPTLLMVMTFLLGFLLAEVFTAESKLKTDAIFYSSYHGRKKAVRAKLRAGLVITNGVYWSCILVFSAVLLLALGTSGWDCPIQVTHWKSFYNISVWQEYLLLLLSGWAGVSFIAMVSMLVSAKTNSATLSVAIPCFIIFQPQMISGIFKSAYTTDIIGLLPDNLLQVNVGLSFFSLYSVGGKTLGAFEIMPWFYAALSALLVPLVYHIYRRKNPT